MEFAAGEVYFIIPRAFDPNASAVRFDNTFGERQSQPCATAFETCLAGGMFGNFTRLIKLRKDHVPQIGIHAHTCIADNEFYAAFWQLAVAGRQFLRGNGDPAIIRRELDGIRQQVLEEFLSR